VKFTKMHGLGNDYVYVNCLEEKIADRSSLAEKISNRNFGIGSDGLICIDPGIRTDFTMDQYNADGSRSRMCGNGIRCLGKFVYDNGLTDKTKITVESGGEIKTLELNVENREVKSVRVNMGQPVLQPRLIPVDAKGNDFINRPVEVLGTQYFVTCLAVGSAHAVTFVADTESLDLGKIGPAFEHHVLFPDRLNTEFIQILDRKTLKMRVWERGSGETLACGTGATASVVAGVLNGLCDETATVKLLGGDLFIEWDREKTGCVFMTGPAVTVYTGNLL
jgi:diaminopimelate epimerase